MRISKGVVMTALVPESENDLQIFSDSVKGMQNYGIGLIEFLSPLEDASKYGSVLKEKGLRSIYLAAVVQKRNGLNLSDVSEENRLKAIEETKLCIDAAIEAGSEAVLITSGEYPKDVAMEPVAEEALFASMKELCNYCSNDIRILLEPGDTDVTWKQYLGSTSNAVKLMNRLKAHNCNAELTMDVSHILQLGEDVKTALIEAEPYCAHIHLANCVLKEGDPLYGDMHPHFTHPEAELSSKDLESIYNFIQKHYAHKPMEISVEVISRNSPSVDMERVVSEGGWFFKKD